MIKRLFQMLAGIAVCVSFYGCMDTVNTAENVDKEMRPDFVRSKRVITDGVLDKRLQLVRIDKKFLETGLLKVQVTLRSTRTGFWDWLTKGDDPYKITYRFHWLDDGGMEISTPASIWLEKDVLPGEMVWLQSVAPNPKCKDFYIKIRELE